MLMHQMQQQGCTECNKSVDSILLFTGKVKDLSHLVSPNENDVGVVESEEKRNTSLSSPAADSTHLNKRTKWKRRCKDSEPH